MYAIIRTGGKQAKVREGDVIDVERLRADDAVTFTPVLVVDAKGKVYSSRKELSTAKVTAKVLGESAGEKIDIFKYKAKTGYRRRGGHRQRYTRIEVTKIQPPKAAKAAAAEGDAEAKGETPAPPKKAPAAKEAAPKTATAKKAATEKAPATKKAPAAKKAATKKAPATKTAATKKKAPAEPKGGGAEKEG